MIPVISFQDFKSIDFNSSGISNTKLVIEKCVRCNCTYEYSSVKNFMHNRKLYPHKVKLWGTCRWCWLKVQTGESEEWRANNSRSQLIAQNKPEQKKKNAEGVSKSWDKDRKQKASEYLKNKWRTNPEFKTKVLKNLAWTQIAGETRDQIIRQSFGTGGLKGIYKNIYYDSALELSYILWCEDNCIEIKNYDLDPIDYLDENDKPRKYFPDFIIDKTTIVEIKGYGLYYRKNFERNIRKINAAKSYFDKYIILLERDKVLQKNYRKARKIHHENKTQARN